MRATDKLTWFHQYYINKIVYYHLHSSSFWQVDCIRKIHKWWCHSLFVYLFKYIVKKHWWWWWWWVRMAEAQKYFATQYFWNIWTKIRESCLPLWLNLNKILYTFGNSGILESDFKIKIKFNIKIVININNSRCTA